MQNKKMQTTKNAELKTKREIILANIRRQVEEVLLTAKKYKPAVLQNESHPYLHEKDLRDYCAIHGIAFQVKISHKHQDIIHLSRYHRFVKISHICPDITHLSQYHKGPVPGFVGLIPHPSLESRINRNH